MFFRWEQYFSYGKHSTILFLWWITSLDALESLQDNINLFMNSFFLAYTIMAVAWKILAVNRLQPFPGVPNSFLKKKRTWKDTRPSNLSCFFDGQKTWRPLALGALKFRSWLYLPSVLQHLVLLLTFLLCYWFNTPAAIFRPFHAFSPPAFLPLFSALQHHCQMKILKKTFFKRKKLWKEYAMQLFSLDSFSCML